MRRNLEAASKKDSERDQLWQFRLLTSGKVSRRCVLVDTFDREAIRRRTYQLYEAKENETFSKLLVTRLRVKTSFQASLKATVEHGISAYVYLLSMVTLCAVALLDVFVDTKEHHCLQSP